MVEHLVQLLLGPGAGLLRAEVIEDGRTGLLVPPRDPEALGAALTRALQNETLRLSMGEAARAQSGNYDIRSCVSAMEAVYDRLLMASAIA